MTISIIVAITNNNVIGYKNALPWSISNDLKYFKSITTGKSVLMGRSTFNSIGKPLPNRNNIVLTTDETLLHDNIVYAHEIDYILSMFKYSPDELFIIGGSNVYSQFLPHADKLYITRIHESFVGDSFFPELNMEEWKLESSVEGIKDDKNPYDYYFEIYNKTKK